MKKQNQLLIVVSQIIITFTLFVFFFISVINSFRFFSNSNKINLKVLSLLIQLVIFSYISIQIYKMNEPRRHVFSSAFLLALLNLSINYLIIFPTFFSNIHIIFLNPTIFGKIHNFTLLNTLLLLILSGINQNRTNIKNVNFEIYFSFLISLFVSYSIPINSPTIFNNYIIYKQKPLFIYIYILFIILGILSYIPSFIQDKSKHNKLKTISFVLFVLAIGILKCSLNVNIFITAISLFILAFSSVFLIFNLKSYSI